MNRRLPMLRATFLLAAGLALAGARASDEATSLPNPQGASAAPAGTAQRLSFRIRTRLGAAESRLTASDATVEGPPPFDLTLHSRAGSFQLEARIKSDLVSGHRLRLVADFTTRREAGRSPRGLPLYEEDVQHRVVQVATDGSESFVVLPFGRNPGGEELAIDLQPALRDLPEQRAKAAPAIRIDQFGPDGWLKIEAATQPHSYRLEAALERQGERVAEGRGRLDLGEAGVVPLALGADEALARLDFTVSRFQPGCPLPQIAVDFTLWSGRSGPGGASLLTRGAATAGAGVPLRIPLPAAVQNIPGHPDTLVLRLTPETRSELLP